MYQAIYRKYRPQRFDDVIGQDDLVRVLKNQVETGRLSHAYIFSGTRGTGKTSCAKILARAVNCLNPQNGNPCNECPNCRAILEERTMDVVEMDAASNRRIDDIRDLRDKVVFAPTVIKYKVYIIDEAHMITNEAFNALLKIMEEPPKHLIFILATTELDKIPDTIQSRCQKFEFNRIDKEGIEKSLSKIALDYGVSLDPKAVSLISQSSGGAMRDAQSIFDQVLATGQKNITEELVASCIGSVKSIDSKALIGMIANSEKKVALDLTDKILDSGVEAKEFVSSLMDYYSLLIRAKLGSSSFEGVSLEETDFLLGLSKKMDILDMTSALDILIEGYEQIKRSDLSEIICRLCIVKILERVENKFSEESLKRFEDRLRRLEDRIEKGLVSKAVSQEVSNSYQDMSISLNDVKAEKVSLELADDFFSDLNEAKEVKDPSGISLEKGHRVDEPSQEISKSLDLSKDLGQNISQDSPKNSDDLNSDTWSEFLRELEKGSIKFKMIASAIRFTRIEKNMVHMNFEGNKTAYNFALSEKGKIRDILNKTLGTNYEISLCVKEVSEEEKEAKALFKDLEDFFGKDNINKI